MPKIEVGQTIYVRLGSYSWFFVPKVVLGETSRSWIVASPSDSAYFKAAWFLKKGTRKLAKNGLAVDWWLGTENDHKLGEWVSQHIRTISAHLECEMNNHKILTIARILEYKHLPEDAC